MLAEPSSGARRGPDALSAYQYLLGCARVPGRAPAGRHRLGRAARPVPRPDSRCCAGRPRPARHVVIAAQARPLGRPGPDRHRRGRRRSGSPGAGRPAPDARARPGGGRGARPTRPPATRSTPLLDAEPGLIRAAAGPGPGRRAAGRGAAVGRVQHAHPGPGSAAWRRGPGSGCWPAGARAASTALISAAIGAALAHQRGRWRPGRRPDRRPGVPARRARPVHRPGRAAARPVPGRGQQRRRRHLLARWSRRRSPGRSSGCSARRTAPTWAAWPRRPGCRTSVTVERAGEPGRRAARRAGTPGGGGAHQPGTAGLRRCAQLRAGRHRGGGAAAPASGRAATRPGRSALQRAAWAGTWPGSRPPRPPGRAGHDAAARRTAGPGGPSSSAHRSAMPHSPLPRASTQPTGPGVPAPVHRLQLADQLHAPTSVGVPHTAAVGCSASASDSTDWSAAASVPRTAVTQVARCCTLASCSSDGRGRSIVQLVAQRRRAPPGPSPPRTRVPRCSLAEASRAAPSPGPRAASRPRGAVPPSTSELTSRPCRRISSSGVAPTRSATGERVAVRVAGGQPPQHAPASRSVAVGGGVQVAGQHHLAELGRASSWPAVTAVPRPRAPTRARSGCRRASAACSAARCPWADPVSSGPAAPGQAWRPAGAAIADRGEPGRARAVPADDVPRHHQHRAVRGRVEGEAAERDRPGAGLWTWSSTSRRRTGSRSHFSPAVNLSSPAVSVTRADLAPADQAAALAHPGQHRRIRQPGQQITGIGDGHGADREAAGFSRRRPGFRARTTGHHTISVTSVPVVRHASRVYDSEPGAPVAASRLGRAPQP